MIEALKQMIYDRSRVKAAYRRVFESPEGQLVLRHLMKEGFVFKSTFVAGDMHQTALNEGSRRVVLSILKMANSKLTPEELTIEGPNES